MKQKVLLHTHGNMAAAAIQAVLYLLFAPLRTYGAEGFHLFTDNPGIRVTAGDSVGFDLHLSGGNAAETDVALSIASMPQGFTGYIKKGNYEVSKVHASGIGQDTIASFQVTVPS